jgi:hypothetical protein
VTVPTDWAAAAPRGEATKSTMARKRKRGIIRPLKLDGTGIAILRVEDSNVSSCAPLLATTESQVEFE